MNLTARLPRSIAEVTVSTSMFETTPLCVAPTFVVPPVRPVAQPVGVIVATAVLEELHVAELVRFCVLPSLNVPVAVNCSVVPLAIEALAALMLIDCSVAAVTVKAMLFDVMPVWVALMFADLVLFAVARPLALTVATELLEEFHVAELVRFCVLPSVKVPVAVN